MIFPWPLGENPLSPYKYNPEWYNIFYGQCVPPAQSEPEYSLDTSWIFIRIIYSCTSTRIVAVEKRGESDPTTPHSDHDSVVEESYKTQLPFLSQLET